LGQDVLTTCAGRTDRGVHALAQVVHLDVDQAEARAARALADLDVFALRLDRLVGHEIAVWGAQAVGDGFDARFSATGRGYRYRIADTPVLAPLSRHDRWHVHEPLAVTLMRAAASHLLGEHDFAAFCKRPPEGRTTVRRLDQVTITRPTPGELAVRLRGSAFCHNQVRAIVGCLVEVGRGKQDPDWLGAVLASGDRSLAARVAPPQGLVLERVGYGRRWPAAPPVAVRTGWASVDRSPGRGGTLPSAVPVVGRVFVSDPSLARASTPPRRPRSGSGPAPPTTDRALPPRALDRHDAHERPDGPLMQATRGNDMRTYSPARRTSRASGTWSTPRARPSGGWRPASPRSCVASTSRPTRPTSTSATT
jgi:tRNA pseudouridine38-40 synthase